MEHLEFDLDATAGAPFRKKYAVVGVVASSDLEVMIERVETPRRCQVIVDTAANGFGDIWKAVVEDCNRRHGLAGTRISINDYAASPATVSLRLSPIEALSE
jgi:malonate decarboxylase delta subunit